MTKALEAQLREAAGKAKTLGPRQRGNPKPLVDLCTAANILALLDRLERMADVLRRALPFIDDARDVHEFFSDSAATVECRIVVEQAYSLLKDE